jgi:aminobenzoyl-glutamate utilization protein B
MLKAHCTRISLITFLGLSLAHAQLPVEKKTAGDWIVQNEPKLTAVNRRIWQLAELGLQEHQSSALLSEWLRENGFTVEKGVAHMPTAFIASYGSGKPVIAILAEFDALPGLSQKASPLREAREDNANGHGCGHSIFGTASTAAAIALRHAMAKHNLPGTIRLYGTPAEETGIGKIYLVKEGRFDDCDAVLHWHASDRTQASFGYTKALVSVKYSFRGLAAHASRSPHEGKSALDAVELMNVAANFLREHLPEDARMHYVITDGGGQPNVVPPTAQVWYYLRADKHRTVEYMFQRLADIAKGAALMTGTSVESQVDSDTHEILPNWPLAQLVQKNLELAGPPQFNEEEKAFARKTQEPLPNKPELALAETIDPLSTEPEQGKASTDVGDVSWKVPTIGFTVATYTLGAPGHSWQIVACTGGSIGEKGMAVAAKTLAYSALELLQSPALLEQARKDFEQRKAGYNFISLIPAGQRAPARIR